MNLKRVVLLSFVFILAISMPVSGMIFGSSPDRFSENTDTIYAGVADDWVNETGDYMTGDLNISQASLNVSYDFYVGGNATSGKGDKWLWANGTLEVGAAAGYDGVADDWVNETGDIMSGDLNITDGTDFVNISNSGTINVSGKIVGNSLITEKYVGIPTDTNLLELIFDQLTVNGAFLSTSTITGTHLITYETVGISTDVDIISLWNNRLQVKGNFSVVNSFGVPTFNITDDDGNIYTKGNYSVPNGVVIWSNGTLEVGATVEYGGATDSYVNTTGDTMTGSLNISDALWLYANGSISMGGNFSVFSGSVVIWSNGTVETGATGSYAGVTDTFVNTTGDNITVDSNQTYWIGNSTDLWGSIYTNLINSVNGFITTLTVYEDSYFYGNVQVEGNLSGNISATNVTIYDEWDFLKNGDENAEDAFEVILSSLELRFTELNTTWRLPVLDKDLNAPPGAPNIGDRYIVAGQSNWYDQRWQYRVPIEIDHNYVYKNETDYPIKIQFPAGSDVFTNARTDGIDILFTESDGQTKIETGELELFEAGNSIGVFWLKLDLLDSTANTTIYAYYGYADANAQYDILAAQNTWKKDYGLVYHMNFTAVPLVGSYYSWDSTGNSRHVGSGSTTYVGTPALASSIDGYGTYFDGVNDAFNLVNMPYYESNWGEGEFGNRTHIIVFNTSADITTRQFLASEGGTSNGWDCYIESSQLICGAWAISNGYNGHWFAIPIEANHDNYVVTTVFRCDDTDRNEVCETSANDQYNNFTMYLNGTLINTKEHIGNIPTVAVGMNEHSGDGGIAYTGINTKLIFGGARTLGSTHFFGGTIQEFHIIDTALDLNAHKTFETMINDTSFMSIGVEQIQSSGATGAWAGHVNNITQYNESGDWHMINASAGWATFVIDESIIYVYNSDIDAWIIGSVVGSHRALADLKGCDSITKECWHFNDSSQKAEATQYATESQNGLMTSNFVEMLFAISGEQINEFITDEFINGTLEDGILNVTLKHWLLVNSSGDNMTGDLNISQASLNVSYDFYVGGNATSGKGDKWLWSNGTLEVGSGIGGVYGGVADDWVNVTGDVMTGNFSLTRGVEGNITLDIYGNINMTGNLTVGTGTVFIDGVGGDINLSDDIFMGGNMSVNNGDVVIWSNGTVEVIDSDTIYGGATDSYVNTTGDYMTGELNISAHIYLYPNGTINVDGNYSVPTGVVIWSNGTVETGAISSYGGVDDDWLNTTGDDLRGNITVNANKTYWLGNETEWFGKIYSDIFRGVTGIFDTVTIGNYTASGGDVVIWSNGTVEVIDSDTIYGGATDSYVNTTGDYMTGELNISGKIYLYPNGTINVDGNYSVPTGVVIWSNGTVETVGATPYGGATDSYVNTTGDQMTGNLTFGADTNITMDGDVVIWSNGTLEVGATAGYTGVADDWVNETGDTMSGDLNLTDGIGLVNISADGSIIMTGDLNITGDGNLTVNKICFGTPNIPSVADPQPCLWWKPDTHNALLFTDVGDGEDGMGLTFEGQVTFTANTGMDGEGLYSPQLKLQGDGSLQYELFGGNNVVYYYADGGLSLKTSTEWANIQSDLLTAGRIYQLPDEDGTLALTRMSYDLNISDGTNFVNITAGGWINFTGNMSVKTGDVVIWSNGTVEVIDSDTIYGGVTDTFVNTTGDNMTSLDANTTYWIGSDSVWWGKIFTDVMRSVTLSVGANSDFHVNSTGGLLLDLYQSCTALETDASGNLICGVDDTGAGASGTGAGLFTWDASYIHPSNATTSHLAINWTENDIYANNTYLGQIGQNQDSCIYFAETGSYSESVCWNDDVDRFELTDALSIGTQTFTAGFADIGTGGVESDSNIWTTGATDDLWLGTSTQANALWKAYADGNQYMSGNLTIATDGASDGNILGGFTTIATYDRVLAHDDDKLVASRSFADETLYPDISLQPDVPRDITLTVVSNIDQTTGDVNISGLDADGRWIFEIITVDVTTATVVYNTSYAFSNVTKIVTNYIAGTVPGYYIGIGNKLGLSNRPLSASGDVFKLTINSFAIAIPTVDAQKATVDFGSVNPPIGTTTYRFWYRYGRV